MEVYRISKWEDTFETAESRRYKVLTWVSLPIGISNGYIELVSTFGKEEAPAIYGAWCALIRIAAQAPKRGTLASSSGKPYSLERLATLSHFSKDVFAKLFDWATSEDVAWIEVVPIAGCHPGATQPPPSQHSGYQLTDPTDPTELTDLTNSQNQTGIRQSVFLDRWDEIKGESQKLRDAIDHGQNVSEQNRELIIKLSAMQVFYGEACTPPITKAVKKTQERLESNDKPRTRWGFLKDQVIRNFKRDGLNFDATWSAIDIPEEKLNGKK